MKNWILILSLVQIFALTSCGKSGDPTSPGALVTSDRAAKENAVTNAWGPLVVHSGEFDDSATTIPWSGSWLPIKSTYLFQSDNGLAPLQKYDLYNQKAHGAKTTAADFEKNDPYLYDPNALGWEGRCDAWATASILEPEPTRGVSLNGVDFTVGDLKALLIKTYETTHSLKQFGSNFTPGSDFNEMYPDQFHRAVQHEIFENHRLMVFDNDPTEQVWNTPLYRTMFEIEDDAQDETVMHVTAYVWGVSAFIPDMDYVGTLTVKYIYTYDLYGNRQADGSMAVAYGNWTGDSKIQHPNFVSVVSGESDHSSNNTQISTDIVNEIIAKSRQQQN
jgi:hypothetical protein